MDRADADHAICKELLMSTMEPLLVPAPVLVELDWLASSRLGVKPFCSFLADVRAGEITIVDLLGEDYARVDELLTRYADLQLGFVDSAVLAVVERLGERKLATLDRRHFATVRPRHADSIELVPVG